MNYNKPLWNLSIYSFWPWFLLTLCFSIVRAQNNQDYQDWFPFIPIEDFSGSVIDMGDWSDTPAGKHGVLRAHEGNLKFEDGTPIKFWGVNIDKRDPFSEKEKVDLWVKSLRKYGVNAVRFHKFTEPALTGTNSTQLDEEMCKNFDYFSHQLRQNGIYYGWSPIYGHKVKPDDRSQLLAYDEIANLNYPWSHLNGSITGLVNFAPDLQDLQITLTVNMLNHKNTVTGIRYADDPALIYVEIQNENNLFWAAIEKALEQAPTYKALLCRLFSDWLKDKYKTNEELTKSWGVANIALDESLKSRNIYPNPNHGIFSYHYQELHEKGTTVPRHILDKMQFLYETQNTYYLKYIEAIRATGYKGLVITSNWQAGMGFSHYYNLHSDTLGDIIDRHNYSGGSTGHSLHTGTFKAAATLEKPGSGLLSTGMQQVKNKPFSISEWIGRIPNQWVAETTPLIGFYGMGLQGWDMSFQFNNTSPYFTNTLQTTNVYNINSPSQMGLYPAIARAVHRSDITEGQLISKRNIHLPSLHNGKLGFYEKVEQGYDNKFITGDIPSELMAVGKVAVNFTDSFEPTEIPDLSEYWNPNEKWVRSMTNELQWNYGLDDYMTVDTEGTQGIVGFAPENEMVFNNFAITVKTPFSIVLATALEKEKTIANSGNVLVTTMARTINSGMAYSQNGTELLAVGNALILMEPVQATLHFLSDRKPQKVHVLDHVGKRTAITVPIKDNKVYLDGKTYKAIYYELVY